MPKQFLKKSTKTLMSLILIVFRFLKTAFKANSRFSKYDQFVSTDLTEATPQFPKTQKITYQK